MEEANRQNRDKNILENDLGFILWKLESIENFLPCYKTIMEHE